MKITYPSVSNLLKNIHCIWYRVTLRVPFVPYLFKVYLTVKSYIPNFLLYCGSHKFTATCILNFTLSIIIDPKESSITKYYCCIMSLLFVYKFIPLALTVREKPWSIWAYLLILNKNLFHKFTITCIFYLFFLSIRDNINFFLIFGISSPF